MTAQDGAPYSAAMEPKVRVLFVCTGNTCRSPLAEGALRDALGPDAARIDVRSAGTGARSGEPAAPASVAIAAAHGIDLSGHRSQPLTAELARSADVVLVMERSHLAAVRALGVDPERVRLLSEWPAPGAPELEVSDPYGGSQEAYEEAWRRISHHVGRVAPHLVEALRSQSK